MRHTLILIAVFTAQIACIAQEPGVEKTSIQPKPAIQERFDKILAALSNSPGSPPGDNMEARREIKDLKDSFDEREITRQLIPYASGPEEEQPLKTLLILQLIDLPPRVVIPEFAPYLSDEDVQVQSFVSDWFRGHDEVDPYKDYRDYARKNDVPPALAQYLFESSPDRAFLVFVNAGTSSRLNSKIEALRKQMDEKRPGWQESLPKEMRVEGGNSSPTIQSEQKNELLLAEHTISHAIWLKKHNFDQRFFGAVQQAMKQLSQLSEHEQWWARLYVAETMRQNQDFRDPKVLEKLSQDDNELVSKAAKAALD